MIDPTDPHEDGPSAADAAVDADPTLGEDLATFEEDLQRFQEDEFVQAALNQGVDLRGYSSQIELELREVEVESVRDYVAQSEQVVDLHNQMQSCDAILARMQEMLLGFQADLGGISDEIKHLQSESLSMNVKLRNRRAVETELCGFLENIVMPPDMVESICTAEVNDAYLEFVVTLNSRLSFAQEADVPDHQQGLGLSPFETVAGQQVVPELEKLRLKAVSKVREYFLHKIGELRKPKTNVQMIQKTALLKYGHLMRFLMEKAPEVGEEVRNTYIETMSRTLHTLFKQYHSQLSKLDLEIANKHDLIAVDENAAKSVFSTKVDLSKRGDAFSLGGRDLILDNIEAEPILVHVAQAEEARFPYEQLFRSIMKHLMDSATNEYLFGIDFFKDRSFETFNLIFARTISLMLENLENYLFSCWDAIGLLLMIKVVHAQRLVMQRRRMPVLDSVFDRINMLLWPRLKMILDANMRSLEQANPRKLGCSSNNPHFVTRRYAEFTASILTLHGGMESLGIAGAGEDMLLNDLRQLRTGTLNLLQRLSHEVPAEKHRLVFLINNYDQVLSVFAERHIVGEDSARFEELLAQHRGLFVEAELQETFGRLITFVQKTELAVTDAADGDTVPGAGPVDAHVAEQLVRDFAATWKSGIESINQDVLDFFSNFRNGMEILKLVLTQLLLYYTRFQDLIKRAWGRRQPPFLKDIVSTATILVEIKKYSRSY